MVDSEQEQRDEPLPATDVSLAKVLAPEDVRVGDYVALLHVVCEIPTFCWYDDAPMLPRDEPVRIAFTPECGGVPLCVKSVCLPYVLVKRPTGEKQTLDVRRSRLARLNRDYAAVAWRSLRSNARRRRKKKRK